MNKTLFHAAAFALASLPAHAQDIAPLPNGDITAFEACFLQLIIDNPGNPMLEITGPILCGERAIPMGQTCDGLDYMLFDRRAVCKTDDLAFWQAQVDTRSAAAIADGRGGVGALHENGLARCAEIEAEGDDPHERLIEINWRTSMEFIAAALVADLATQTQ